MLDSLPVVLLVGTVLGFLAGLGVGGGSLLILWLTLIAQTPQEEARNINLLFFHQVHKTVGNSINRDSMEIISLTT